MTVEQACWLFKEIAVGEKMECSIIYRENDCHFIMYQDDWDEQVLEHLKATARKISNDVSFGFNVLLVR